MGDELAEILFTTLQETAAAIPPFRILGWNELTDEDRAGWQQVAAKARSVMHERFVNDMRDATAAFGAEQAIANLLDPG